MLRQSLLGVVAGPPGWHWCLRRQGVGEGRRSPHRPSHLLQHPWASASPRLQAASSLQRWLELPGVLSARGPWSSQPGGRPLCPTQLGSRPPGHLGWTSLGSFYRCMCVRVHAWAGGPFVPSSTHTARRQIRGPPSPPPHASQPRHIHPPLSQIHLAAQRVLCLPTLAQQQKGQEE